MNTLRVVLLLLIVVILGLDASWMWAVYGQPRTYLRALLDTVPRELQVTGYDFAPTLDGSTTAWDFRVPRDVANSLRQR